MEFIKSFVFYLFSLFFSRIQKKCKKENVEKYESKRNR